MCCYVIDIIKAEGELDEALVVHNEPHETLIEEDGFSR